MNKQIKPIVLLRPTAVEKGRNSIYSIKENILLPTPKNIDTLVSCLNNDSNIKDFCLEHFLPVFNDRCGMVDICKCEKTASEFGINIIGATFLNFLHCYGFSNFQLVGEISVHPDKDIDFLNHFFPLLIKYLYDENNIYAKGVREDILGKYKMIRIHNGIVDINNDLKTIVTLKQIYRYFVRNNIPAFAQGIKCNLIHTADDITDLNKDIKIFFEKKHLYQNLISKIFSISE